MIRLYLMRHGQAEGLTTTDEQRALTSHGHSEVHQMALHHLVPIHFDFVFVSPYLRAQQSWEEIKKAGVQFRQVETVDWVTPESSTQIALDKLVRMVGDDSNVLVVCHQPFVGKLATQLTDGNDFGLVVATAGIITIETDVVASQCGTLCNVFKP